ncbi:MAG: LamG-like jellyroll fold domain-containing protein [bacterium]|nr:LamG-like jellyroll fold domain-containing protein [bacterium]
MKKSNFKSTGIRLSILLSATALLILQLSGGGRLTASDSDEPMSSVAPTVNVLACREPGEILSLRDRSTRVFGIVRDLEVTYPDGRIEHRETENRIVHTATNLCYEVSPGVMVPSVPEFRPTPEGYVADRNSFSVSVGAKANAGAVLAVNGVSLRACPSRIIVWDAAKSEQLASLDADAQARAPEGNSSLVSFADALGVGTHVEYVVGYGELHQNVVFSARPVLPDGLDPNTAKLSVYSKVNFDELAAECDLRLKTLRGEVPLPSPGAVTEPLCELSCYAPGANASLFSFIRSRAYDSPAAGALRRSDWVEKCVARDANGETFLVETIPYSLFFGASFPVLLDYLVFVSGGSIQDQTWEARNTYVVEGPVYVNGTLTIEPGTTVKFKPNGWLSVSGKLLARGEPWNFITFTSSNDNSCGETVPGSGGNPQPDDYYMAVYLANGSSTDSEVSQCKIAYPAYGVYDYGVNLTLPVANNIVMHVYDTGITLDHCNVACFNNLVADSYSGISLYETTRTSPENGFVANNTIDLCNWGVYAYDTCAYEVKDNLLTGSTYGVYGSLNYNFSMHHNRFYNCQYPWYGVPSGGNNLQLSVNPYATAADDLNVPDLGDYYINDEDGGGKLVRDNGSETNAQNVFPGDTYTVIAPPYGAAPGEKDQVYGSSASPGNTTWTKTAYDTGPLDIGYHHNRVDVFVDNVTLQFTGTLSLSPGVVVAIRNQGSNYIPISQDGKLPSAGEPYSDGEHLARGYNVISDSASMSMKIESPFRGDATNPRIFLLGAPSRVNYTIFQWLGNPGLYLAGALSTPLFHNVFALCSLGVYADERDDQFNNNLFCENDVGCYVLRGHYTLYNSTLDRNSRGIEYQRGSYSALTVKDSLFTHNSTGIYLSGSSGDLLDSYNAFYGNTLRIWDSTTGQPVDPGLNSINLVSSPYSAPTSPDWTARYRLNQDCPLIDAGSRTSIEPGLDIFTTASDGRPDFGSVPEGEKGNTVDIGYHFPIGGPEGILYQGYRQTDIALRWNNMTDGCLRAFSFDGHARDEMGNEDGVASSLTYGYYRYTGSDPYRAKYDYNQCAIFDGSTRKVNIGNAPDLQMGQMGSGTISAWVYATGQGDGASPTIFFKGANDGEASRWLCLTDVSTQNGTARLYGYIRWTTPAEATSAPFPFLKTVSERRWHHVAMTWDGASSPHPLRLYYDGEEVASSSGSGSLVPDSNHNALIGATLVGGQEGNHFKGYVADVFIYKRVLLADEIRCLALNGDYYPGHPEEEWLVTPNTSAMGEYENFPLGQMQSAVYAVEDSQNNIWVSEFGVPRVTKLNQLGEISASIGGKKFEVDETDPELEGPDRCFYGPWGLALDAQNRLYVVDEANDRIQVFNAEGDFQSRYVWGSDGADDGQFNFPICVAVRDVNDDTKWVYVNDRGNHRIQKFAFYPNQPGGPGHEHLWSVGEEFTGEDEGSRGHDQFVNLEGICCDGDGNIWVVDAGTGHDKNFLKKFRPDGTFENDPAWRIYRDYGTHDLDVIAHGVDYHAGQLYLSFGELDPDEHYYIVYDPSLPEGEETVRKWGTLGSLPTQNVSGWGSHITPRATLLSTDWLGCKVLEWNLNGSWIRTFQSSLRSDAQSIKCTNHTKYEGSPYPQGQPKQAYQTTILSQGSHKIEFLAYTDGDPVGIADVLPYAAYTGQSANQVGIVSWENYVITEVDIPNKNDCQAAYVWGTFSVPADKTALPWKVGVEVKANDSADKPRLVYIASLRCSEQ